MDRLQQMAVFAAVAETGSFAAGARRLGLSPPAVTRAVSALETHLGVSLAHRTTRRLRLTAAGERYLEDAQRVLAAVAQAEERAVGLDAEPRGQLVITAPVLFGRRFVMPAIVDYLRRYPETRVRAVFLDRIVDLLEEGIDLGVRIGELPDSSLRARRLGQVRLVVCASPAYLDAHGRPDTPDALRDHTLIASRAAGSAALGWGFDRSRAAREAPLTPRLEVTSNDAAIAAACAGFGLTRLLSYQVDELVRDGALEILLEDHEPAPRPVHVVHREGPFAAARVRAFVDGLAEALAGEPALQQARPA